MGRLVQAHSETWDRPEDESNSTAIDQDNAAMTSYMTAADSKTVLQEALHLPFRPVQGTITIAILDHTAELGGGEIALLNLVRSLDVRRHRPVVLLFSDGPLRLKLEEAGIEVSVFELDRRIVNTRKDALSGGTFLRIREVMLGLRFVWLLSLELRRRRIDIVHTNSLKSDILGGLAARLAGIPLIWHVRDRIDEEYLPKPVVRVFRFLARYIPSFVIANSAATMSTLRFGSPPGAVDTENMRFRVVHDGANRVPTAVKKEPRESMVVGLVGRITPWKGQHVFLKAASLVRSRFPGATFQIIGAALFSESDYEREIHRLTETLGLSSAVEFTGFRQDVSELIAKLDVLVHASTIGEPFGQVIIEGMAAGKPIVATNGGGVPEIVVDGITGLLVPMGDEHAMADAISRLLGDRDLRKEIGRRGRQRFNAQFTIQHTADNIQRVYNQLFNPGYRLSSNRRPGVS